MQIADILSAERVVANMQGASKKRVLEKLSEIMAENSDLEVSAHEIFDSLIARERIGTTAINHGVAIPHGRIKNTEQTIGALVQLKSGIDCDAMDQEEVRLLFAILVPEESTDEHLQLLARLAQMFSDEQLRQQLREAKDDDSLYQLVLDWDRVH